MRSAAADFDLVIRDRRAYGVSDLSEDFLRGSADLERNRAQYLGTCGSISVDQASIPPVRLKTFWCPLEANACAATWLLWPVWQ